MKKHNGFSKKIYVYLVIFMFVFAFIFQFKISVNEDSYSLIEETFNLSNEKKHQLYTLTYIPHPSIEIHSDEEFETYGFPGNGTEFEPYIIDGLNITTENSTAINIYDVTKYFIIQNCYLDAQDNGITLWYVAKARGKILNNICCNNNEDFGSHGEIISFGIEIMDTPGTIVSGNHCYNNNRAGIIIDESDECTIQNNFCFNHPYSGILVRGSNYTMIKGNTCYDNEKGIEISSSWLVETSNHGIIVSNLCYDNEYSLFISGVNNTVEMNSCSLSTYGIFSTAWDTKISKNSCTNNTRGIDIEAIRITLENNTFMNNEQGFFIDCDDSFIIGNLILMNQINCEIRGRGIVVFNNTIAHTSSIGLFCMIDYGVLIHNTFENNLDHGLYFSEAMQNTVHHNNFLNNNVGGSSQAFDNGSDIVWYDKETKEGNYWTDWDGDGSYEIAGPSKSVDKYPLGSMVEELGSMPDIPNIPGLFEGLFGKLMLYLVTPIVALSVIVLILVLIISRIRVRNKKAN